MFDKNQITHLVNSTLNTFESDFPGESAVDDLGLTRFGGQVGAYLSLREGQVRFDSTIGTLHGGIYQLVKTAAVLTIAATRGKVAFWSPAETNSIAGFLVDTDAPAGASLVAGIFLRSVAASKYCFIQVAGLATVLFIVDVTKASPAVGDLVVVDAATSRGDVLADATAFTSVETRHVLGIAWEAPADVAITGGLFKVLLTLPRFRG